MWDLSKKNDWGRLRVEKQESGSWVEFRCDGWVWV